MPLSRKKSCMRCRQSKLRCNQATPSCSRCSERGTRCVYDRKTGDGAPYAHSSASRAFRALSTPSRILEDLPDHAPQSEIPSDLSFLSSSMFINPLPQAVDGGGFELDWTAINAAGEQSFGTPKLGTSLGVPTIMHAPFSAWTGGQASSETEVESSGAATIGTTGLPPNTSGPSSFFNGAVAASDPNNTSYISIPNSIELRPPHRTFQRRHIIRHCAVSSVVLGQLTSFTKMMIQGERLPPFICPPCYLQEELAFDCAKSRRHKCFPKELAICASLVEMFHSRTAQNAEFVWKTIYAEKDRLQREHESFDIYQQLAALQAIIVYILLQAQDVETSEANGAESLLSAVMEISMSVSQNNKNTTYTSTLQKTPDRQQWVHEESVRRTMTILFIIDLMLDGVIETQRSKYHSQCSYYLNSIPLPATRDLWEAPTNFIWRTEYERYLSRRKTRKTLTVGDLLEMDEAGVLKTTTNNTSRSDHQKSDIVPDILTWCEGLDSMGSLLWLILPFQQWRLRRAGMGEVW